MDDSLSHLTHQIHNHLAVCVYFTSPNCQVCAALNSKIRGVIKEQFPKMFFYEIDCKEHPEVAARFNVFTIPTILIFFDGKETIRKVRHFSIRELADVMERFYRLIFDEG